MKINKLCIFMTTAIVLGYISATESTDVGIRRRNKDGICADNNDCYSHEKCVEKQCTDVCISANCGSNAWCSVTNHEAACQCWENFIGDPHTGCVEKNCTINNECKDYEKCENNRCVNACDSISCGHDTRCKSISHDAYCVCIFGLVGDPATKCGKKSCSANSDCYFTDKCENNECVYACEGTTCGANAWCEAKDHAGICTCPNQFNGDPHTECVRQNCTEHDDCYGFEKCESNKCIPACDSVKCGENAICNVNNHVPECQCGFQMTGDPHVKCVEKECTTDSDCAPFGRCINNKCSHLCENALCGDNAFCDVKNHTASCICTDKYTGDPQTGCVRQSCSTSEDCHVFETCEGTACVPACDVNKCGINAWCNVENHISNCSCSPGFIGDPSVGCEHKSCTANADCSVSEKCENKRCIDACEDSFCPFNTMCKAQDHSATCACYEKHDGDAYSGCVRQSCSVHNDCFEYEACENNKCVLACESVKCEDNSWCNVKDHVGVCTCYDNTIPEPGTKCKEVSGGHFLPAVPYSPVRPLARGTPALPPRPISH